MLLAKLKETLHSVLVEVDEEIAVVAMNRPKALNALNAEMLKELRMVMECIAEDEEIKGVILTGTGEKSFIAGADITEFIPLDAVSGREFAKYGQEQICDYIENFEKPVIAAINGYALGGGNEISMACDIRIASTSAVFGHPEVGLGIMPLYAGTKRLTRLVGFGIAKELIMTSRFVNHEEAMRIGLVNKVVEPEGLLQEAKKMMRLILQKAPMSIRMSKVAMNKGCDMSVEDAAELERNLAGILFSSQDKIEGVDAFLNHRKAKFLNK